MTTQQMPLTIIAADATSARPMRSARRPATTQPIAPLPMTTNEASSPTHRSPPLRRMLCLIITGAQVHIA